MRVDATTFQDPHMIGDQVLEPGPLCQPQDRREPGASPAHDTRLGSSNATVKSWHTRIYRMPFCAGGSFPKEDRFSRRTRAFRLYDPRFTSSRAVDPG
jgi:hypothetical protein